MGHQFRDIFRPLPQGRNDDGKYIEAVPEVFPEAAPCNHLFKISVGGTDDTDINGQGGCSAQPFNNTDTTNADLDQYRGYFNFQLSAGNPDGFILNTNTRWADKGPSFQADLSYLLKTSNKGVGFYRHLQYFNGYAETLLHYQQKDESIRLGLSIVR